MELFRRLFGLDPGKEDGTIKFTPRELCHDREGQLKENFNPGAEVYVEAEDDEDDRFDKGNRYTEITVHVERMINQFRKNPQYIDDLLLKLSGAAGCDLSSVKLLCLLPDDDSGFFIVISIKEKFVQILRENDLERDQLSMPGLDRIDLWGLNIAPVSHLKGIFHVEKRDDDEPKVKVDEDFDHENVEVKVHVPEIMAHLKESPQYIDDLLLELSKAAGCDRSCIKLFCLLPDDESGFYIVISGKEKFVQKLRENDLDKFPQLKRLGVVLIDFVRNNLFRTPDEKDFKSLKKNLESPEYDDNHIRLHVQGEIEKFKELDLLLDTMAAIAHCERSSLKVVAVLPDHSFIIIIQTLPEIIHFLIQQIPLIPLLAPLLRFNVDWIAIRDIIMPLLPQPPKINLCRALVFQGGGAKGIAYCGVVQKLNNRHILERIERFAGASAGAICAAFLAMKFSPSDLEKKLRDNNFQELLLGGRWYDKNTYTKKAFRFLKFLRNYGLYSTSTFHNWLGKEFEKKIEDDKIPNTGKKDITFEQVYNCYGKELCIIVTNVCTKTEEYYHPKTTPNFPVRDAVQMSMLLPGIFRPKTVRLPVIEDKDYFIDGGVTCNFPIHCFDGWWLKMENDNSFINKLQIDEVDNLLNLQKRGFLPGNSRSKTLGFCVMSQRELLHKNEDYPYKEENRIYTAIPNTDLARKKTEENQISKEGKDKYSSVRRVLKVLNDHGVTTNGITNISRDMICNVLSKVDAHKLEEILRKRKENSLEQKTTMEKIWEWFWKSSGGDYNILISLEDIKSAFLEITNHPFAEWTNNEPRRSIQSMTDYAFAVNEMLSIEGRRKNLYRDRDDDGRTIKINTAYVDTTDFDLHDRDKEFLIKEGKAAAAAFLDDQCIIYLKHLLYPRG